MIGVYIIKNNKNGKLYIGQSWNIEGRWRNEKSLSGGLNNHLESSIRKYGINNFSFDVLECFEEGVVTQSILDEREDHYIVLYDTMNPSKGYNKKRGSSSGKPSEETRKKFSAWQIGRKMSEYSIEKRKQTIASRGGYKHSEETRRKLSDKRKYRVIEEKTRKRIGDAHRGKVVSRETREKLSEVNKGKKHSEKTIKLLRELSTGEKNAFYGRSHTEESKKKISEANLGKKRTPEQIKSNRGSTGYKKTEDQIHATAKSHWKKVRCVETGQEYESVKHAGLSTGVNSRSISRAASGTRRTGGELHWEYF